MNLITPILAFAAFILSLFAVYSQWSSAPNSNANALANNQLTQEQQSYQDYSELPSVLAEQTQELDIEQLQQVIEQLHKRINLLEQAASYGVDQEQITEIVEAYVAEKEQQEQAERLANDPFHSFYESLPEDYEQKLKTDPEYAQQMQQDLRQKVLDTSLTEQERLQAMGQLQMTAGMLGQFEQLDKDNALSNAIMDIVENTDNDSTRIQALEAVSYGPSINPKLAPKFLEMTKNDSNNYVRNLAANGLGMMMYSQGMSQQNRQQLADSIINMMRSNSDPKLKDILQQNFGSEQDIEESLKHMQEDGY